MYQKLDYSHSASQLWENSCYNEVIREFIPKSITMLQSQMLSEFYFQNFRKQKCPMGQLKATLSVTLRECWTVEQIRIVSVAQISYQDNSITS